MVGLVSSAALVLSTACDEENLNPAPAGSDSEVEDKNTEGESNDLQGTDSATLDSSENSDSHSASATASGTSPSTDDTGSETQDTGSSEPKDTGSGSAKDSESQIPDSGSNSQHDTGSTSQQDTGTGVDTDDPCLGITEEGCCDGEILYWCFSGKLMTYDCKGYLCGWKTGLGVKCNGKDTPPDGYELQCPSM
jgi:hypothetical protein